MSKGKGKKVNKSFSGVGGKSDPTNGLKPSVGGVVSGSKNVNPPNAKSHAGFGSVGGKVKGPC